MEVFTKIVFRLVLVFVAQVKGIESYTFLVHIWDFGFHLWCVILSRKKILTLFCSTHCSTLPIHRKMTAGDIFVTSVIFHGTIES